MLQQTCPYFTVSLIPSVGHSIRHILQRMKHETWNLKLETWNSRLDILILWWRPHGLVLASSWDFLRTIIDVYLTLRTTHFLIIFHMIFFWSTLDIFLDLWFYTKICSSCNNISSIYLFVGKHLIPFWLPTVSLFKVIK